MSLAFSSLSRLRAWKNKRKKPVTTALTIFFSCRVSAVIIIDDVTALVQTNSTEASRSKDICVDRRSSLFLIECEPKLIVINNKSMNQPKVLYHQYGAKGMRWRTKFCAWINKAVTSLLWPDAQSRTPFHCPFFVVFAFFPADDVLDVVMWLIRLSVTVSLLWTRKRERRRTRARGRYPFIGLSLSATEKKRRARERRSKLILIRSNQAVAVNRLLSVKRGGDRVYDDDDYRSGKNASHVHIHVWKDQKVIDVHHGLHWWMKVIEERN